jgi:hypothetical protein
VHGIGELGAVGGIPRCGGRDEAEALSAVFTAEVGVGADDREGAVESGLAEAPSAVDALPQPHDFERAHDISQATVLVEVGNQEAD